MSSTMTIRLDDAIKERLELLAGVTHRSKSFLASEAIREFVELNEWQLGEIKDAIQEADAENFATDDDVTNLANKWKLEGQQD